MTSGPGEPAPPRPPDEGGAEPEVDDGALELLSGALFTAIGIAGWVVARGYAPGTTLNMGPGYVPQAVAAGLAGLGVVGVARGFVVGGRRLPRIALRPLIGITGAIVVFALTIDRFGLFVATFASALLSAASQAGVDWRRAPLVAFALAGFCALLFGYGLKLSIPVWPR